MTHGRTTAIRHRFTWISPQDMGILVMLIEGATLLMVGLIGGEGYAAGARRSLAAHLLTALPEGFGGIMLALVVWHAAGCRIRCRTTSGPLVLTRISTLPAAAIATVFLLVLWLSFDLLPVPRSSAFGYLILGFTGMGAASTLLVALYRHWPFKLRLALGRELVLRRGSLLVGPCTALYEAIILPLMWLLFGLPLPAVPLHLLTGLASGFVGGFAGTVLLNRLLPLGPTWLEFAEAETASAPVSDTGGGIGDLAHGAGLAEGQPARGYRAGPHSGREGLTQRR